MKRLEVDKHIPEGENAMTRLMSEWRPETAHHEMVKRVLSLFDVALKISFDAPRFPENYKKLEYTDELRTGEDKYRNRGYYLPPDGKVPARWHVKPGSKYPVVSGLHEVAHHLGGMLGGAAEEAVSATHKETDLYKKMMNKADPLSLINADPAHAEYLSRPREVFARALAQLVVEEVRNFTDHRGRRIAIDPDVVDQFKRMAKDSDSPHVTWTKKDFARVREALVKQLNDAGWTLRNQ